MFAAIRWALSRVSSLGRHPGRLALHKNRVKSPGLVISRGAVILEVFKGHATIGKDAFASQVSDYRVTQTPP
jgi:hypothetical protein